MSKLNQVFRILAVWNITLTLFAQSPADSKFYLIDSVFLEEHEDEEVELIQENLKKYHQSKSIIKQLYYLSQITENSNDYSLWPKYNDLLIEKAESELKVWKSLQDKREIKGFLCDALNNKGYLLNESGNKELAKKCFHDAIDIARELKDETRLINCFNNLGQTYAIQGNIPLAIKYSFKSLRLAEKTNDLEGVAIACGNIGVLYDQQNELDKALEFYFKGLAIQRKIEDKSGIATSYNNIGYIFNKKKNNDKAIHYYKLANKLYREIKEYDGISASYTNIGSIHYERGEYDAAIDMFNKALEIDLKIDNKKGVAYCYSIFSRVYKAKNEFQKAKEYALKALNLANEISVSEVILTSSETLFSIYEIEKDWKNAFEMQAIYFNMKDSINGLSNQKEVITQAMNYSFEKQQSLLKKENEKKLAISKERQKKQQIVMFFGVLGLILVSVFSYFIFKRYKFSQLQNKMIQAQKEIIEEKQREISSSISYAERIQTSFLASKDTFELSLKDYFIFFKPKDVVSGDFYWANQLGSKLYLCVADSTGHGIPGAFMSLLNISLLNEGLLSKNLSSPNELLDFVRRILILGLKPDESGHGGQDGMDCSLICIDFENLIVSFSGANNPLWIVRDQTCITLEPDKMPVGRSPKQDIPFSVKQFQLKENDSIYLFSDGLADQFGGPKGKKFKYKALQDLICTHSIETMNQQSENLERSFLDWKGNLEQVDDICIVGVRI